MPARQPLTPPAPPPPTPPTSPAPPDPGERLTLREWQVWHTYASFFDAPLPPLEDVARRLVANGIAECAVTSDGDAWWATDDVRVGEDGEPQAEPITRSDRRPIAAGRMEVTPDPDRVRSAVRHPPGVLAHPYATEGLFNWAWARHVELRLYGDGPLPPRYVLAVLGECTFTAVTPERRRLGVYPQLKIFETGVVLVHLRMLSPERPMRVEEFIPRYLNAGLGAYRWVHVPPGIAAWAPLAAPVPGAHRSYRRPWTAYHQWYHQRAIARQAEVETGGDFAFRQVSLGLAQDAELAKRTVEEAEPEIQRRSRDVLRAAAAARGVHLSPDLGTITLDPGVTLTMDGVALGTERAGADGPDAGEAAAGEAAAGDDTSPRRVVDLAEIYAATARAADAEAKRLGRALGARQVYAPGREPETFRGLALTIMAVAGVVAGTDRRGPRRGLALALLGPGAAREVGAHWTGRPHTHLLRFAGQSASAAENARRFAADLGRIMLRAAVADDELAARQLPPSTRAFDDHGAYLAVQGTLWVYTSERPGAGAIVRTAVQTPGGDGTAQVAFAPAPGPRWAPTSARSPAGGAPSGDPGTGGADADSKPGVALRPGAERPLQAFEHQTKVETLEYAYMLHRRIADRATRGADQAPGRAAEALLAAQRDLADFEWALQDTGRYGEVREQLEAGLVAYGVPKLRERVAGLLRVRQEAALYRGGAAAARWAAFLAVVAGVLAVPPLTDAVVKPAWRLLGLPRPARDEAFALALAAVAFVAVGAVLAAGHAWARRGRRG